MEKKVIMMMGIMKEDTVTVEVIVKVMMKKDQTNITDQVNAFQELLSTNPRYKNKRLKYSA